MINQQSAAKGARQVRSNTNLFLSAAYQHDRLHLAGKRLQQRSQGPQQQQSTPSSKEFSRGQKTPNAYNARYGTNECHPLVSSVDTVNFYYDLHVAQLNNRRDEYFSLIFCVENAGYTLASCHKICRRQKTRCVWSYSSVPTSKYIACTRVQTMSICPNLDNTTLGAPGTQPLAMLLCLWIFLGQ